MRKSTVSCLVCGLIVAAAGGVVWAVCPLGDLTGDCRVDPLDLGVFAEQWLTETETEADFDANGQVGLGDFQVLAQAWRSAPIPLVINEVMAANSTFAKDLSGDFDDWIEIHNAGRTAIDLGGMYLTDDATEPTQWQFPVDNRTLTTIPPRGYLIIWADEDATGIWLHANFKLDADGDEVHLFAADGVTPIDRLAFGEQTPDISFGRHPDAGNTLRFFGIPTPGQPNNDGYLGEIESLRFSHERGFYDTPFDVTILCPTEGAEIIYTVNGKRPDDEGGRFRAGRAYTNPLQVDATVVLRAMAVKPGWKPTAISTHSYIFNASERFRSLPLISLVGDSGKTFYEPDGVMAIVGGTYDGGVWNSTGAGSYNNVMNRGLERPVSCEWIEPEDSGGFQIDGGLRVHGSNYMRPRYVRQNGTWSGSGKFSLRLYFRNQYGPGPLEVPLFAESDVEWFKSIVLRAGHNDRTNPFIKDELLRRLHKDMGQRASMGTFANLFINGEYKGYFNPAEHIKDDACQQWFDSDEPWDVMTMNGIRDGNSQSWNDMVNYARSNNLALDANYQELMGKLDVVSFIDYLIIRLWPNDWDWPQNNWAAAAERSAAGRWKFFAWDAEGTFVSNQLYVDRFGELNSQSNANAQLYRALKVNRNFRQLFGDRVYKHFNNGGALSPANINERFSELRNELRGVIPNMNTYIIDSWTPNRQQVFVDACVREAMYTFGGPIFAVNGVYQQGGYAATGDLLQMVPSRAGADIYYTLDGTDPSGSEASADMPIVTLVSRDAAKHILVPEGPEVEDWMGIRGFDGSGWILSEGAPGGVGYEHSTGYEDYLAVDLDRIMYGVNGSCYIRIPFSFSGDRDALEQLTLKMQYDDGFVAYLNGAEVARRNFEGTPAWNSTATASHGDIDAIVFESIDISDSLLKLRSGANVLAIQGLNSSATSSDLLIAAELSAMRQAAVTAPTGALRHTAPIALAESVHVKARVRAGNTWSALSEATFAVGPVAESLRISEIMYHPDDPNTEYIELTNIGAETINLNFVKFTKGIDFAFSEIELASQAYALVVRDVAAFEAHYGPGLPVVGAYAGSLSNAGEQVELQDAAGAVIQSLRYRDAWYEITDGAGFSLTARDPAHLGPASWTQKDGWRPSAAAGGSPGFDDAAQIPELGTIVINELLANSAGGVPDWIELHNTSDQAMDVGGWFFSDQRDALTKYEIAAETVIAAQGYLVLSDDQHFGNEDDPGRREPFGLSRTGETLYLHSGSAGVLTGYSEQVTFGPSDPGVAFGRYQTSVGAVDFVALAAATPGAENAEPRVGPIVISEIMYHPQGIGDAEYVELLNISDVEVTLYDFTNEAPWRFTDDPDNPSIDLLFPDDPPVTLGPSERLVLAKDRALVESVYGVRASAEIFEWGTGNLDNGSEPLQLSKPGVPDDDGNHPWIAVDRVVYSDGSHGANSPGGVDPWTVEADGFGLSLNRTVPEGYGNDPNNWYAADGSPGAARYRPSR
jgi:CotH kinase protein/Lamin Tail Domain/Chitobiase/beta-hexosaminidase C-terminal domain